MKRTTACIIARTNSKRLRKKALLEVQGTKVIEYIIQKIKRCRKVDEIFLCTSIDDDDRILLKIARQQGIKSYAGDRENVVNRMLAVADLTGSDTLVRITGDNIFTDEAYIDLMLKHHAENGSDYSRTEFLPIGLSGEAIEVKALQQCLEFMPMEYSEYMMLYLFQPEHFNCQVLVPPITHRHPEWSLTVDTPDDWQRTLEITEGQQSLLRYHDIMHICSQKPVNHLIYQSGGSVKLPADINLSYKAFRVEIEMRIEKARKIQITEKDYWDVVNEQII